MLKIYCPKHPRYAGLTSPRAACQGCQDLWGLRMTALGWRLGVGKPPPKEKNDPDSYRSYL